MSDPTSRNSPEIYARPDLLRWLEATHCRPDDALLRAFHCERDAMPTIQVQPLEARFLSLMAVLTGAKKAVEIGTLAGYSGIHLARGMGPDGHLWTVEFDPHHAKVAERNFKDAGCREQVTVVLGDAREQLPTLTAHGPFDLVFVDADKENYPSYLQWASQNLRKGGLLIGDNAFYFGKLLDPEEVAAKNMRSFHETAATWKASTCLPTPDGMLLAIRG